MQPALRHTDVQQAMQRQQACLLPMNQIALRQDISSRAEDSDALNTLADSIIRNGLIQAITVRPTPDGRYVIESGNRRFRACRMAGMRYIDALVLPVQPRDREALALLEGLRSGNLTYWERADAMRALNRRHGLPPVTIAAEARDSERNVDNLLRLAEMDGETRAAIEKAQLPERAALALLRVPEGQARRELAARAVREKMSVSDVELMATSVRTHLPTIPAARGQTIGAVRDGRLYVNALRTIAAQMREAGLPAEVTESAEGRTLTVSVRVSTRRRRSDRYHSRSSQAVQ